MQIKPNHDRYFRISKQFLFKEYKSVSNLKKKLKSARKNDFLPYEVACEKSKIPLCD